MHNLLRYKVPRFLSHSYFLLAGFIFTQYSMKNSSCTYKLRSALIKCIYFITRLNYSFRCKKEYLSTSSDHTLYICNVTLMMKFFLIVCNVSIVTYCWNIHLEIMWITLSLSVNYIDCEKIHCDLGVFVSL